MITEKKNQEIIFAFLNHPRAPISSIIPIFPLSLDLPKSAHQFGHDCPLHRDPAEESLRVALGSLVTRDISSGPDHRIRGLYSSLFLRVREKKDRDFVRIKTPA